MKTQLITFLLFFVTSSIFAQNNDEAIVMKTPTGNIHGALICPKSSEAIPVVLIIAGSGPTDRNGNNPMMKNNSLKMLAQGLAGKGIASLRYDKRGVAESQKAGLKEEDLRFENYIDDARQWVDLLKKDKRFSSVIILGHSEGSLIGMVTAQKKNSAKFISLAGVGSPAGELIREQLKAQPPMVQEIALPILSRIEKGDTVANTPPMLNALFRPSVQPYLISWFKYHPQKEIAKLKQPILIIQGTTDIQVKVSDAEKLGKANKNAKKSIIKGMNHILKEAPADQKQNFGTYSQPDLPLIKGLIDVIAKFIKK